jgi:hypothetical protein
MRQQRLDTITRTNARDAPPPPHQQYRNTQRKIDAAGIDETYLHQQRDQRQQQKQQQQSQPSQSASSSPWLQWTTSPASSCTCRGYAL